MKTDLTQTVRSRAMRSRESVVQVIVRTSRTRSQGSGFVVKLDDKSPGMPSLVFTCEHVVRRAHEGRVFVRKRLPKGVKELPAEVVATDYALDVALLKVRGLSNKPSLRPLALALNYAIGQSGAITGYSNPTDLFQESAYARQPAVCPGSIRAIEQDNSRRTDANIVPELLYLDGAVTTGVSGGPVVGANGVQGMCRSRGLEKTFTVAVSSTTLLQCVRGWAGLPIEGNSTLQEAFSLL